MLVCGVCVCACVCVCVCVVCVCVCAEVIEVYDTMSCLPIVREQRLMGASILSWDSSPISFF